MEIKENKRPRMEIIREGLFKPHPAGDEDTSFADAVLALFKEFTDDYYREEWERIDDNERLYQGNHWQGSSPSEFGDPRQPNMPRPATPIITSAIENIKADLSDGFPEASIKADGVGNEVLAKVLSTVVEEELDTCGFEREYDRMVHDVLTDGWGVWEVGYDANANNGHGGSFVRSVVNKNWMCDPQTPVMQDGRAVFKFDRKPQDWFAQHYPDQFPFMSGDDDLVDDDHDDFGATTSPNDHKCYRLIEAWFRVFDPETRRHAVHFVKIAGRQVLENSAEDYPSGYYRHGEYPFIICRLYPQKGSALGLGITDLFKDAQRFSDKLDQILLVNAFRASRPRIFTQKGLVDYDDVRDFSKEVIECDGTPASVLQWQQPQPLPAYIMEYISVIRNTIKQESGTNDQSRGQTGSGVTAASAITALQEMSTKRSRMEERQLHYAFREAVRMLMEVIREFAVEERLVACTVMGQQIAVPFSRKYMKSVCDGRFPLEHYISIKSARQTKYTRMMHNELMLQMMQIMQGTVDPVIMMEGLDYDGLEPLLEKVRHAQQAGMVALQQQNAQLQQQLQAVSEENGKLNEAVSKYQKLLSQTEDRARAKGKEDQAAQEEASLGSMGEMFAGGGSAEQQGRLSQGIPSPDQQQLSNDEMQGMLNWMG